MATLYCQSQGITMTIPTGKVEGHPSGLDLQGDVEMIRRPLYPLSKIDE